MYDATKTNTYSISEYNLQQDYCCIETSPTVKRYRDPENDIYTHGLILQWMEHDAPMSGWTQVDFPISFQSWYKVVDSVCNTYIGNDAAFTSGPYTINTGRSTLSYLLFGVSQANTWYHPHFICIGY